MSENENEPQDPTDEADDEEQEKLERERAVARFLEHHDLSPSDVSYLEDRLSRMLKAADRLAPIFFQQLFEQMPHVEELFDGDETSQMLMFNSVLWSASACLKDPDHVHTQLAEIGESHAKMGISSLQLRTGGAAFVGTMKKLLPTLEFREREELWEKVYEIIIDSMQRNFTMKGETEQDN